MKQAFPLIVSLMFSISCTCAGIPAANAHAAESAAFGLTIVHTNDSHSYLAGRDSFGNACMRSSDCTGGMGRISAAIKEARAKGGNVLALDAGDQFQGTLFYTANKWPMLADIDTFVPYDAMTLGNHEFDDGCTATANFIRALPFPALVANIAPQAGCPLHELALKPYIVRDVGGVRVGIVGLTNPEARNISSACPHTNFTDSTQALHKAVTELQELGVRHVVLVSHLGLPEDRRLARTVEGVDVIVGGHTHSYLGPDSTEGPYPVVEHSPAGQPVLVVTAKFATEYLGVLEVFFNAQGVPVRWQGAPRRMDSHIVPDKALEDKVADYSATLDIYRTKTIGRNDVIFADGMEVCRQGDCLSGMVVTDAMLDYGRPYGAVAALTNSGGLRAPLHRGDLNQGDILAVLPFGNMLVIREYSGAQLLAALEHSIFREKAQGPRLLQAAGLRYGFDPTQPAGKRLSGVEIADKDGTLHPVNTEGRYAVVLPNYMAQGGDGYTMLTQGTIVSAPDPMDADIVGAYIQAQSPLKMPQSGRIIPLQSPAP